MDLKPGEFENRTLASSLFSTHNVISRV